MASHKPPAICLDLKSQAELRQIHPGSGSLRCKRSLSAAIACSTDQYSDGGEVPLLSEHSSSAKRIPPSTYIECHSGAVHTMPIHESHKKDSGPFSISSVPPFPSMGGKNSAPLPSFKLEPYSLSTMASLHVITLNVQGLNFPHKRYKALICF